MVEPAGTTSYAQLLGAAAAMRTRLVAAGVRPGDVVGVTAGRSARTAAAVLGIWAAGAAYLPLDPGHPVPRLAFQVAELGCPVLVDSGGLPAELAGRRTVLTVSDPRDAAPPTDRAVLPRRATLPDLAYVMYTSGSTGQPKGVGITHHNLANVVDHFSALLDAGPQLTVTWLTTFAFDISALELVLPLTAGGRVVVVPDEVRTEPAALLDVIDRHGVTVVQATPTTWRLVAATARAGLQRCTLLCGGEPLLPTLARQLLDTGARVFNVYGPTETTIWSTARELTESAPDDVGVGQPIANTQVAVVDPRGRPLPPFVRGELCIAGAGVAPGYCRRPDLTAQRFAQHPELGRSYLTGDVASWRADGSLELFGRQDRQVKLRGHRIELAEIENVLTADPLVRAAAVDLRADGPDAEAYLVAFVECPANRVREVWDHVAARLPAYSVPERIVAVDALPTTPNGKVDVSGLSALPATAAVEGNGDANADTTADTTASRATALVAIWRSLLVRRDAVDEGTNFFLAGGNSLLALRLLAEIRKLTNAPITLMSVFRAPTPRLMATLIESLIEAG
jgi:amino acid adenylation domain-containing protein